jgi:hypothetical protein
MAGKSPHLVNLSPGELGELLGLDAADSRHLGSAAVRVPAAWVADWKTRTGAQELSASEVAMILGVNPKTVTNWIGRVAPPTLRARRVAGFAYRVSPAELARFLRALNGGTNPPPVVETPNQERRRAATAKERAAAACRGR